MTSGDCGFAANKRDADRPPGSGLENFFSISFAVVQLLGAEGDGWEAAGKERLGGKGGGRSDECQKLDKVSGEVHLSQNVINYF